MPTGVTALIGGVAWLEICHHPIILVNKFMAFMMRQTHRIKALLNAYTFDLFTCSSATEANHWWLYSVLDGVEGCPRVIASAIEHPCVLAPLQRYANDGRIDLQLCRVLSNGQLDMAHYDELLTESTIMVSVMLANNEIGSIQPLAIIADKAKAVGALVHSDIVQAAGKIPIDLDALPVDAVSNNGHVMPRQGVVFCWLNSADRFALVVIGRVPTTKVTQALCM